jgi:hypothetical protein
MQFEQTSEEQHHEMLNDSANMFSHISGMIFTPAEPD